MLAPFIHDPATHKLGRLPVSRAARRTNLRFGDYVRSSAAAPNSLIDWGSKLPVNTGAKKNDVLSDCTAAGYAQLTSQWKVANGLPLTTPTDAAVVNFYSGSTGYSPSDPSTDQGGNEPIVLAYAKSTGIQQPDGSFDKILGSVEIDPSNLTHVGLGLQWFGGLYTGMMLPATAQKQGIWTLPIAGGNDAEPGSWGGHCTVVEKIDYVNRLITIRTWGIRKLVTFDWWLCYLANSCGGACYALISMDWVQAGKAAPSGLMLADLLADAPQVGN